MRAGRRTSRIANRRRGATLIFSVLALSLGARAAFAGGEKETPSAAQIRRGEYLARAGDCVSCHSSPQGGEYGGGLRINTPYGFLITPNITFDPVTGIGGWTKDDFWNALHSGYSKRGYYLYPVMPYTFFTKATREDVDAIYDFLSTVPSQIYPVDVNHLNFPFSIRSTMLAWNELYFTPGTYQDDRKKGKAWNRGAYLVQGVGHCGACHDPRNFMGAVESGADLSGGRVGDWFATNLTPNKETGLGKWNVPQVVTFLKRGQNAHMVAEGPMAEVVHNSLKHLTDADLRAIAEYLKSQPAAKSEVETPAAEPFDRARAALLYVNNCSQCHGPHGSGLPAALGGGPSLAGNALVVAPDPANIIRATVGGLPAHFGRVAMPSQLNGVTAQQLADIINYVRTSWGNHAAPNATVQAIMATQAQTAPH